MVDSIFSLQPERAMKFWGGKLPMLRDDFNNLAEEMKDRAFVISRITSLQQVQKIYDGIAAGLANGTPMTRIVEELRKEDIALSAGHLRTVVNTNLKTAYSAGRWQEIQASKKTRPYIRYRAVQDGRTRADHASLDGMIFPVDDPFWIANQPPNGFNCRCSMITLSQRQVDKLAAKEGRDVVTHTSKPFPVNKDFAGTPGQPYKPDLAGFTPVLRERLLNDTARYFSLKEAGEAQLRRYFNDADAEDALLLMRLGQFDKKSYTNFVNETLERKQARGKVVPAGRIPAAVAKFLRTEGKSPHISLITIDDTQLLHMQRDAKQKSGQILSLEELLSIPDMLKSKDAGWFYDGNKKNLAVLVKRNEDEVIKISINTDGRTGTPYVVTAGVVSMDEGKKDGFKKLR